MSTAAESRARVAAVVRAVAADPLGTAADGSPEAAADAALAGFDSLAVVQLLVALEKEFGLSVPSDVVVRDNFRSVAALTTLVRTHRAGGPILSVEEE